MKLSLSYSLTPLLPLLPSYPQLSLLGLLGAAAGSSKQSPYIHTLYNKPQVPKPNFKNLSSLSIPTHHHSYTPPPLSPLLWWASSSPFSDLSSLGCLLLLNHQLIFICSLRLGESSFLCTQNIGALFPPFLEHTLQGCTPEWSTGLRQGKIKRKILKMKSCLWADLTGTHLCYQFFPLSCCCCWL